MNEQQRDNLEMALVMWTAVDPEHVALGSWSCGSHACFGGHLASWEHFIEQGVRQCKVAGRHNGIWQSEFEPYMGATHDARPTVSGFDVAVRLFGDDELFNSRREDTDEEDFDHVIFETLGRDISDHELALRRMELKLFGAVEIRP